ncbi:MAG: FtsQ-type POTRA domain-containing protein [Acidimicrobiia bacterium]
MSTRPVDPRVRERWIAARRAEGRHRLRIVLSVAGALVVLGAAYAVVASPLFDVDRVGVKGTVRTTAAQVQTAAGVHRGDAMVWIDGGAAAQRIAALPWIRDARVEREWPGTVTVVVTERSPAGWVDTGSSPVLVDGTGRVLERVSEPPTGLPQIVSPKRVPPVGATITPAVGAEVAGRLGVLARAGTRTVMLTPGGVVLGLVSGPEIRLGEPTHVNTKIRSAIAVLTALDGQTVGYIDVTVPSNPVAGPPV